MVSAYPNQTATKQWTTLISTSFRRRIRADQLTDAFREQWSNDPIPGTVLVSLILTSGAPISSGVDPLIPAYVHELLKVTTIDTCDVLMALLSHSRYAVKNADENNGLSPLVYDLPLLESIFALLLRLFVNGERPRAAKESRRAIRGIAEWMTACNYHETMLSVQAEGLRAPETSVISALETLGTFSVALFTNDMTTKDIQSSWSKDLKDKLCVSLNNFATLLTQWTTSQVGARMQMIARTPPLTSGTPDFSMAEIASAVIDLPVSTSRTGIYIYLNAALCAKPLTDDLSVLNYLRARYQDDGQALTIDLIVGSFDTLANALHRHEPAHSILCHRSFIANKLPLLLVTLTTALFPPPNAQLCIQSALGRIEVHPFPPLSSENDGVNDALKNSRHDFVQACVMFHLGTESAFSGITGEPAAPATSRTNRYYKENLTAQCVSNVHRVDALVRELEAMNGNVGAISGALVETLQHLCNNKETMSLRTLCNAFTRKLPLLDIVFQYAHPTDILLPLCKILNEWTHDEDQSEFQPPYEEFASLLLLVLAIIHRYHLSESDLGLDGDSFVLQLLARLSTSIPTKELTLEQGKHLSKWMQGLYATDEHGETNGISDETMSHCPPQDFYLIVPTLLEQSMYGCKANTLALNTLQGGLEFLLEPFLLPSLVGGLSWLTKHSWEDHGDAEILLQVLQKLLQPTSISGDAQAMHQTIIAMISAPLDRSLRELNRRMPNRKEIASLMEVLKPHLSSHSSSESTIQEVTQWTTQAGGIRRVIKDVMHNLIMWSNNSGINPIPTNYTHRIFLFAVETLGADDVLRIIIDEVKEQTQMGFGSTALEVGTALICAPSSVQSSPLLALDGNQPHPSFYFRRDLRQALRHKLESPKDMLSMETEHVEALIRLGRRVDAQSTVPSMNAISMPITNLDSHDIMQDINMAGTDLSGGGVDMQSNSLAEGTTDQFSALEDALDLGGSGGGSGGLNSANDANSMSVDLSGPLFDPGQDLNFNMESTSQSQDPNNVASAFSNPLNDNTAQGTEEDIFAGLDMGDMGDMGDDDFSFG